MTGGYLYDARIVGGLRARGNDVRVVELPTAKTLVDPWGAVALFRALCGPEWDAVVVDELAHPAMALGLPAWRLLRARRPTPVIALVHHLRCSEPGPRLARSLAGLVERLALRWVDLVVCTSATTAAHMGPLVPRGVPSRVVAPGRDLHVGSDQTGASERIRTATVREPPSRAAPSRSPYGVGDPGAGELRVLTVAHWTPRKGIVETLRAVALASPKVRLELVGDPDRDPGYARRVRAELRRPELAGRVRVHGRVSSEHLARLYRDTDALLLASSHEGYGMVLGEALAAGLPIVATRVGAVPEVVRDGQEAELVGAGDVRALARALDRLARDPAERWRRAAWAHERAAGLPTWEQSCAAFAEVVHSMTGPPPSQAVTGCGHER